MQVVPLVGAGKKPGENTDTGQPALIVSLKAFFVLKLGDTYIVPFFLLEYCFHLMLSLYHNYRLCQAILDTL